MLFDKISIKAYDASMSNVISSGKAAKYLGIAIGTLRRWDREGRLVPAVRTETNRRMYTEAQLQAFLGEQPVEPEARRVVAYCRVSSQAQKPDLVNQRHVLEAFVVAKGLANVDFLEEIGGGLRNYRKSLDKALKSDGVNV